MLLHPIKHMYQLEIWGLLQNRLSLSLELFLISVWSWKNNQDTVLYLILKPLPSMVASAKVQSTVATATCNVYHNG